MKRNKSKFEEIMIKTQAKKNNLKNFEQFQCELKQINNIIMQLYHFNNFHNEIDKTLVTLEFPIKKIMLNLIHTFKINYLERLKQITLNLESNFPEFVSGSKHIFQLVYLSSIGTHYLAAFHFAVLHYRK